MNVLQYSPGALVSIIFETLGNDGYREDGYYTPSVQRLFMPDLSISSLYPIDMVRIDQGLYFHKFQLPTGAASIGSYIIDILYYNAAGDHKETFVQVICSASSSGSFSVSPN